jgi:hypothetical protein
LAEGFGFVSVSCGVSQLYALLAQICRPIKFSVAVFVYQKLINVSDVLQTLFQDKVFGMNFSAVSEYIHEEGGIGGA